MGGNCSDCRKTESTKDRSKLNKKDAVLIELRQRRVNDSIHSTYEDRHKALDAIGIKDETEIKHSTPRR
jgi:hypothetical protein